MAEDMLTDITLDHLPDLSDASVSFQIPAQDTDADLLLADQTGSFNLLCRASDSDASFAPVSPRHPRGPPLTLSELTPRVLPTPPSRSPTPTAPTIPALPLTLGHRSPRKRKLSLSSTHHVARPLVSEEHFNQLRAQVQTLRHPDDATHGFPDNPTPSSPISTLGVHARPSEDQTREEREAGLGCQILAAREAAMLKDAAPANATDSALPTPRPKATRNPRTTAKPTVAAGSISKHAPFPTIHVSKKAKSRPSHVQEAHNVPLARQPDPPQSITNHAQQEIVPPANSSGNTDAKSENTQIVNPGTGGLADRLVSYSQRLISSIGLYKPYSESCPEGFSDAVKVALETHTPAAAPAPSPPDETMNDTRSTCHEPFRLSKISPHKPPDAPQPNSPGHTGNLQGGRCAVSPSRPAKKRVSADADLAPDGHLRKKGKTTTADEDFRGSSDGAQSQAGARGHAHHEVMHGPTWGTGRHPKSMVPNARTKYRPRFDFSSGCRGPTLDPFPYLSRSRQVRRSWIKGKRSEGPFNTASVRSEGGQTIRCDEQGGDENAVRSSHAHAREPFEAGDLPLIEKKQNATLCVPLTKPVGFTFRVDARLDARREERLAVSEPGQVSSERPGPKPPRFASLHGRPPTHASVAVIPFNFCTEQRAREREKFDAMVRRKEDEAERERKEVQQREAEEEEREVREMRRRTVPKANAIPEWYAGMPKRRPV